MATRNPQEYVDVPLYVADGRDHRHDGATTASPGLQQEGDRVATAPTTQQRQNTVTISEPPSSAIRRDNSSSDDTAAAGSSVGGRNGDVVREKGNGNDHYSHTHGAGIKDKLAHLRHRGATKKGEDGVAAGEGPNAPRRSGTSTPDRQFSSGPRGFIQRVATGLSEPRPSYDKEPTWRASLLAIAKASWLNLLLVFIPVSWACHFAHVNDTVTFVMSFLAIIPLAKLLGFGTEELAMRVGQTIGGLLNATLGNVVELIVAILALVKCELQIVQSSLLGSILSNLLLVLGMCFFAGGLRFSENRFGDSGVQINSSLLVISVIAILIPAGFHAAFGNSLDDNAERGDILAMSRGTAVIVLSIYVSYMIFQLWSHSHLFNDGGAEVQAMKTRKIGKHTMFREAKSAKRARLAASKEVGGDPSAADRMEGGQVKLDDDEEEVETPSINVWSCILLLCIDAALVGVTAEWLVDSINGLTATGNISTQWVGLILLPIVGNAAEHVTAVTVAAKDKLDLSIGVAVGSSIQIALFVIPLLVVLGWIIGKPLSLLFDPFESVTLFLAVLLANYTLADGASNWLEGYLLMMTYLIIAVAFWYYPSGQTPEARLLAC